jgi:hypothetical protein
VYAVFSGFGTGHVFKSTNAGASWTDMSASLPDMPFECITVLIHLTLTGNKITFAL